MAAKPGAPRAEQSHLTARASSAEYEAARALAEHLSGLARYKNIRTGTAGWADKSLIASGAFYPAQAKNAEARLRHYAAQFSLVEVDATYYAILPADTAQRWVSFTPEDFQFDIKAHPILTGHPIDLERLPKDLKDALLPNYPKRRVYAKDLPREVVTELELRFEAFLAPLNGSGKLRCLALQFPPWVSATRGNVRAIEQLAERWQGYPLSIEFRHPSWLSDERRQRVFDLLRTLEITYVMVDEPNVAGGGVPPIPAVTNPRLAVVRFHGQNPAGWQRGASVAQRFNYLYSPVELRAWAPVVARLASEASEVHAIFNNCVRDFAVVNAKGLAVALANSVPLDPVVQADPVSTDAVPAAGQ